MEQLTPLSSAWCVHCGRYPAPVWRVRVRILFVMNTRCMPKGDAGRKGGGRKGEGGEEGGVKEREEIKGGARKKSWGQEGKEGLLYQQWTSCGVHTDSTEQRLGVLRMNGGVEEGKKKGRKEEQGRKGGQECGISLCPSVRISLSVQLSSPLR